MPRAAPVTTATLPLSRPTEAAAAGDSSVAVPVDDSVADCCPAAVAATAPNRPIPARAVAPVRIISRRECAPEASGEERDDSADGTGSGELGACDMPPESHGDSGAV